MKTKNRKETLKWIWVQKFARNLIAGLQSGDIKVIVK